MTNPTTPEAPPPAPADSMRVGEVARLFSTTPKTVLRWADAGLLPCFRTLGGHRRFYRQAVVDAYERNVQHRTVGR